MAVVNQEEWNHFLEKYPNAHILQEGAWGEVKSDFGWDVRRVVVEEIGAQILFKSLPMGYSVAYIPRGPVAPLGMDWQSDAWEKFLAEVDRICHERRAVFLKVEPDLWKKDDVQGQFPPAGFQHSAYSIQPPRTILVSLREEENEILGRMKSKTRYNTRLARRKEVVVRKSSNIEGFYEILANTADRADFGIHNLDYYQRVFKAFAPHGKCKLLTAEYQSQPLASVMVFARGERSWYFYGASSNQHRDRMPTYLVQWEAMCWAKEMGCSSYDLWGVPDEDFEILEDQFLERHDGLWGVYRFKRGFGGDLERVLGPWDRVYKPLFYRLALFLLGRGE